MLTNITCSEIHRESGRGGEEWCTFCMYNKIKMCGRVRVHKWLLVGAYENLLILELVSIHCQHFSLPKFLHANIFIVNTKPFYMKYTLKTSTISTCYLFYGFLKGAGAQPSTGRRHSHLQGGGRPGQLHSVMSLIFTCCCLHYIRK